jgi:hypothetical protein
LRGLLDQDRDQIRDLGNGKLETFIENYFPHIWEKPSAAKDAFLKTMGRRPLHGSKAFLKKRSIESIKSGVQEHGLTPVSYNPIDLAMLKHREMQKYVMATKSIEAMKDQGLVKFVKTGGETPEGYTKINDAFAQVFSRNENKELVLRGNYMAHPAVATLLNNHLSPGLRGNIFYDLYRGAGNSLNQFQLGLSAFHLGFTSADAIISKTALGIREITKGNILGGLKDIAVSPATPITNLIRGDKLYKAWHGKDQG